MKKIGIILFVLTLSVLCGCSPQAATQEPLPATSSVPATSTDTSRPPITVSNVVVNPEPPKTTTKPVQFNVARDLAWEQSHQTMPWINPGTIDVGNFRAGGVVEYPVYYHNGSDNIFTEQKRVITETDDPIVTITLKYKVLGGDANNISNVASDLAKDKLKVTDYQTASNQVTINGMADNSERIITITYTGYKEYQIYYRAPDGAKDGWSLPDPQVAGWVTLSESLLRMEPYETKEIMITLAMPLDATVSNKKWAYYIGVSEQLQVTTENVSTCHVTMK